MTIRMPMHMPMSMPSGGLSHAQRKRVHLSFLRDKTQVVVATLAFGMGIDKPDVRLVVS